MICTSTMYSMLIEISSSVVSSNGYQRIIPLSYVTSTIWLMVYSLVVDGDSFFSDGKCRNLQVFNSVLQIISMAEEINSEETATRLVDELSCGVSATEHLNRLSVIGKVVVGDYLNNVFHGMLHIGW